MANGNAMGVRRPQRTLPAKSFVWSKTFNMFHARLQEIGAFLHLPKLVRAKTFRTSEIKNKNYALSKKLPKQEPEKFVVN